MEASRAKSKGQGAAATTPDETVEQRAIGSGRTVRNRRTSIDADVERAESRGVYRDHNGTRRIVGAGQPVPDGWTRIEDADVAERVDGLEVRGGVEGKGDPASGGADK